MTKDRGKRRWENELRTVANRIYNKLEQENFFEDENGNHVYAPQIVLPSLILIQSVHIHPNASKPVIDRIENELKNIGLSDRLVYL
jgi:hypothetical protein